MERESVEVEESRMKEERTVKEERRVREKDRKVEEPSVWKGKAVEARKNGREGTEEGGK